MGARARLAESLRSSGLAGTAVSEAFRSVPRHVFLPQESAALAYDDMAIVIKSDAGGLPVSASTQPAMMAIMLEQLGLAARHRVLEIGTGSGYNAALIAHIVGDAKSVVTIEIEPDLADQARAGLAAVGFGDITVVCGDGADGVPGRAPYDRIIVTGGAWDLAPPWLAQLAPGGRIVAPVSVRGIQLAVAFERDPLEHAASRWIGTAARRCQFVRMAGPSAGPEKIVPLGPRPGLHALVTDGPAPEAGELHAALSGLATDVPAPSGLAVADIAELADLDLWLALTEPGLSRLSMMGRHEGRANQAQRRIASLMPLGGFAEHGGAAKLGVAALAVPSRSARGARPFGIAVQGYGPGGAALAARLAERAVVWDELGRPGAGSLELAAYPAGTRPEARAGTLVIRRPKTVLVAGGAAWNPTAS
ncbi:MAG TPA: methyltransferase domain-containing protein [Trebonia sp.]|jgi:protein-L-isoaspartate(D-aspartate) O-methyltransferase|nr:methyltransferase domain-containing protein [Trebonia sp.]